MGKRRDRRHAALGGGGRRMKLDLSLDDDDDDATAAAQEKNMSISTTVEEGGEKAGVESEERLSPHSLPGPVQVNPLSLLGQYSDEDEEEEKTLANGSSGGVSAVGAACRLDEQVADFLADLETSGLLKEDEVINQEDKIEAEGIKLAKSPQDLDVKKDEVSCEWEAVLHKETNEYYYWNKVTSETTWEKPPAYAASEALKRSELQDIPVEDSKSTLEDPMSRSEPVHEVLVQEVLISIEVKDPSGDQPVLDAVEGDQLNDGESEGIQEASESEGIQEASRDDEERKETEISLEAKEDSERMDSPLGIPSKTHPELDRDAEVIVIEAAPEQGPGEAHRVEEIVKLSIVENGEDAENPKVVSISCEVVGDHAASAHREDAAELKKSDPEKSLEQAKRYDHQRLLERGEVLAQKFKILAGEALRNLSSKIRLAIESEIRLSDCNAMAMSDEAVDWFWEHMDFQLTRLEALLVLEQAASSLEAEQQLLTSNVEDANPQSGAEGYVYGAQDMQHLPAAALERSFDSSAQLRTEAEDMDVDMDVDMETEDQNFVGASAAALSVDHGVPGVLISSLYESTVPQPVVYMAPPSVPQVVSYGVPDAFMPPPQSLPTLAQTPLFPVAPLFPSMSSVFPAMQSSVPLPQVDSWIPPPPPEDEWAPPPLPDQEAPPPPPDEEEPPLPSASDINSLNPSYPGLSVSMLTSGVYYPLGTTQTSQATTVCDRHDTDGARFGVVDTDNGFTHDNGNGVPPSVVSTGAAETATKKPSSKLRVKKRAHSAAIGASRISNKKVSTLVNKWIAAQEELHSSDEEEDDNNLFDIEALEKKRQKEIEEWRHQTLASGGALENANFQPLGTLDWRERVKRAKKEASKLAAKQEKDAKAEESNKDHSEESNTDVASTTPPKKPDLKELSKDLPPGWQAFWDAASRDVYYGNVTTSETSWDRPPFAYHIDRRTCLPQFLWRHLCRQNGGRAF